MKNIFVTQEGDFNRCKSVNGDGFQCEKREGHDGKHYAMCVGQRYEDVTR